QRTREGLEESLWVALRMLEERKHLLSSMVTRGDLSYPEQQQERMDELKKHTERLREFLLNGSGNGPDPTPATPAD
ncbi:MAG: hypothetical protein H7Z21_10655, partial [Hymenobacter sp.]|nr:hypothetical protein [Hymenobacter sp.]